MKKLFGIRLDGVGLYILDVSALGGDFHYTTEPEGFPDLQDRFFAEDRFPLIIGLAGIFFDQSFQIASHPVAVKPLCGILYTGIPIRERRRAEKIKAVSIQSNATICWASLPNIKR